MLRIQHREFINWQELDCSVRILKRFEAIGRFHPNLAESRVKKSILSKFGEGYIDVIVIMVSAVLIIALKFKD